MQPKATPDLRGPNRLIGVDRYCDMRVLFVLWHIFSQKIVWHKSNFPIKTPRMVKEIFSLGRSYNSESPLVWRCYVARKGHVVSIRLPTAVRSPPVL